jgi:hypothetical protein
LDPKTTPSVLCLHVGPHELPPRDPLTQHICANIAQANPEKKKHAPIAIPSIVEKVKAAAPDYSRYDLQYYRE